MEEVMPEVYQQLDDVRHVLEKHYKDMQDVEFTVQRGKLYMLQTRTGKRTAPAALKIAVDMVTEGLITEAEAIRRLDPNSLDQLLHPTLDPKAGAHGDQQRVLRIAERCADQVLDRRERKSVG